MIVNEVIHSGDMPDEFHENFCNLIDEIVSAIEGVTNKKENLDGRLFLSALSVAHASLLASMMDELEGRIDPHEYLRTEMEAFIRNYDSFAKRLKKPPSI